MDGNTFICNCIHSIQEIPGWWKTSTPTKEKQKQNKIDQNLRISNVILFVCISIFHWYISTALNVRLVVKSRDRLSRLNQNHCQEIKGTIHVGNILEKKKTTVHLLYCECVHALHVYLSLSICVLSHWRVRVYACYVKQTKDPQK